MPYAISHSLFLSVAETSLFTALIFLDFVVFHPQDLSQFDLWQFLPSDLQTVAYFDD